MIDREKVERAIDLADKRSMETGGWDWDEAVADAAIAAVLEQLREPTLEMVRAGGEIIPQAYPEDPRSDAELITEAWQAMLDAASPPAIQHDGVG